MTGAGDLFFLRAFKRCMEPTQPPVPGNHGG